MTTTKPTLGEFFRTQCHDCGTIYEIPEPLTTDERPDVRAYLGVCPRCQAIQCHAIGATPEAVRWASESLRASQRASEGQQSRRYTGNHH